MGKDRGRERLHEQTSSSHDPSTQRGGPEGLPPVRDHSGLHSESRLTSSTKRPYIKKGGGGKNYITSPHFFFFKDF